MLAPSLCLRRRGSKPSLVVQRAPYAFWHFIELNRGGGTGDSWADWQAELGFIQVCSLPVRERIINVIFLALVAKVRMGLQRLGECGAVSVSLPTKTALKAMKTRFGSLKRTPSEAPRREEQHMFQ